MGKNMNLIEKLNSYDTNYWDFADYRENNPIIQYPAKMVAPMQKRLLSHILEFDNEISNVMDPFTGSGTVLDISRGLGLDTIGYDINPLATLITRVRLEGIPSHTIYKSISALFSRMQLLLGNVKPYYFRNINKWFRDDVILSLTLIREAIMLEKDARTRRFFWCCFAEIVRKFSNTRSSTFKLHQKEQEKIDAMSNNCINEFKDNVNTHYNEYCFENKTNIELFCGDSKELLKLRKDASIDLICTSPPYGDNQTTVTYGQYSILQLLWIDINDLEPFDIKLLETFSAIDRESLGGKRKGIINEEEYQIFMMGVGKEKHKKVVSFWSDYEEVFLQMSRVLKQGKLMVLTLGNRRVDNQELAFDQYNDYLAHKYNFTIETTLRRKIMGKRMPRKVSCVAEQGAVESMSKEYVKIYRKR